MPADRGSLLAVCRAALTHIELAESLSMSKWLLPIMPDGRTLKQHFAEAAALARTLDRETDATPAALLATAPRTAADRERRPVLMLTRELRECLGRVAARLEAGASLRAEAGKVLDEVSRLIGSAAGGERRTATDPPPGPLPDGP